MIILYVLQMIIMLKKYKVFLNVYMTKEIFIKEHMKDGIVRLVNLSGQNLNLLMDVAQTVVVQ